MQFAVAQHIYGYYYRGGETRASIDHLIALAVREPGVGLDQDTRFVIRAGGVTGDQAILLQIREAGQFTN